METAPVVQNKKIRQRNPEAKRAQILAAALKEFSEHGYSGARSDQIATRAGVSVGSVFKIFQDKETLANHVFLDCLGRIQQELLPFFHPKVSPREAFDGMWKVYVDFIFQEPETLLFFEFQPNSAFLSLENKLQLQKLREALKSWIERCQSEGAFKKASTECLRALAIGSLMRVLREMVDGHTKLSRSRLNELRDLVWVSISQ